MQWIYHKYLQAKSQADAVQLSTVLIDASPDCFQQTNFVLERPRYLRLCRTASSTSATPVPLQVMKAHLEKKRFSSHNQKCFARPRNLQTNFCIRKMLTLFFSNSSHTLQNMNTTPAIHSVVLWLGLSIMLSLELTISALKYLSDAELCRMSFIVLVYDRRLQAIFPSFTYSTLSRSSIVSILPPIIEWLGLSMWHTLCYLHLFFVENFQKHNFSAMLSSLC